eukprot:9827587-Lingulodinium_polyedra.AAC.1
MFAAFRGRDGGRFGLRAHRGRRGGAPEMRGPLRLGCRAPAPPRPDLEAARPRHAGPAPRP